MQARHEMRHSRTREARPRESSQILDVPFLAGFPLCASLSGNDGGPHWRERRQEIEITQAYKETNGGLL